MSSQITNYTSTRILSETRVNIIVAIDWCSHTTNDGIWLVSCFGFNGPLGKYFSLYWAVSQRGRKKREMIDERKMSKQPPPVPTTSVIGHCPTFIQVRRKVYPAPSHHLTTPSRLDFGDSLSLSLSLSLCKNNKQFGFILVSRRFRKATP